MLLNYRPDVNGHGRFEAQSVSRSQALTRSLSSLDGQLDAKVVIERFQRDQ